jgi:DHA1 family tetracycline resistance protein-like MFS transporter
MEGLAYALVLPHLPLVVGEHSPWWAVGGLLAAYSIAQFLVLPRITNAARRHGTVWVVFGCLIGTATGMILTAVSTNFWILLAGRLVDGLSAGTVVVVTALHLASVNRSLWTRDLGRLAAVRGAAILGGVVTAAILGVATANPAVALRTTAWIGAVLAGLAIPVAARFRHLDPAVARAQPTTPTGPAAGRHIAAQAAQAALLTLAPALALTVSNLTAGFLGPAAAISGLAVGQLVAAPRLEGCPALRSVGDLGIVLGSLLVPWSPLAGLALMGIAIGAAAPIAQAALLRKRTAAGEDILTANAFVGRASIIGHVLGPLLGYVALSVGLVPAIVVTAVFGGVSFAGSKAGDTATFDDTTGMG